MEMHSQGKRESAWCVVQLKNVSKGTKYIKVKPIRAPKYIYFIAQ